MNPNRVLVLLLVAMLAGCSVTDDEWAAAEKACASNGGVARVFATGEVHCKNGAYFSDRAIGKQKER